MNFFSWFYVQLLRHWRIRQWYIANAFRYCTEVLLQRASNFRSSSLLFWLLTETFTGNTAAVKSHFQNFTECNHLTHKRYSLLQFTHQRAICRYTATDCLRKNISCGHIQSPNSINAERSLSEARSPFMRLVSIEKFPDVFGRELASPEYLFITIFAFKCKWWDASRCIKLRRNWFYFPYKVPNSYCKVIKRLQKIARTKKEMHSLVSNTDYLNKRHVMLVYLPVSLSQTIMRLFIYTNARTHLFRMWYNRMKTFYDSNTHKWRDYKKRCVSQQILLREHSLII